MMGVRFMGHLQNPSSFVVALNTFSQQQYFKTDAVALNIPDALLIFGQETMPRVRCIPVTCNDLKRTET